MKIIISIILILMYSLPSIAQVGINTDNPQATVDIANKNTPITKALNIENSTNAPLIVIDNDGNMGIGNNNPKVKLDLRTGDSSLDNTIKIGTTTLTATDAGQGALRYNATDKVFEYSDGLTWLELNSSPNKIIMIAQNGSAIQIPNGTSTTLTNWTVVSDDYSCFNATTGYFTAPRAGVYFVSCTAVYERAPGKQGGQTELNIVLRRSAGGTGGQIKSITPIGGQWTASAKLFSNTNKGAFWLETGDSIYVYIWQSSGFTYQLSADASLNTLTISEM